MEWVIENWHWIREVLWVTVGILVFAYRVWRNREVDKYIGIVLDWVKKFAGESLEAVTEEEVYALAGAVYDKYIAATLLGMVVSRKRFQELSWAAWRWFVELEAERAITFKALGRY